MSNCTNNLNETQLYIMEIVKPLLEIAKQLKITCWMQGGTMLGAVRHHGFIPWDDDVDIGIMRKDYEVFIKEAGKYLPAPFKLQTYKTVSEHHYYFARIVNPNHIIQRNGSQQIRNECVWVDIFPLDGMPNNFWVRRIHMMRLSLARFFYHLSTIEKVNKKRPGRSLVEKTVINIALHMKFFFKFDIANRLDCIDYLLKKYSPDNSEWIINFMGQTSFKFTEMLPKKIYGEGMLYEFENLQMTGPLDYDSYLHSLYGDYMIIPKDAEKNAHVSKLIK